MFDNSEQDARQAAEAFSRKWSDEHGIHKNQIRRLPDGVYWKDDPKNGPVTKNTLEVQIDKDYTMLVDFDDIAVVSKYCICKTKGGTTTSKHYAVVSFKGSCEDKKNGKKMIQRFHKFLTGNEPHQPEHHGQPTVQFTNQKSEQQQQKPQAKASLSRNEGMFLGFLGKTPAGYRTRAWSSSRSGNYLASADQTRQQRTYRGVSFSSGSTQELFRTIQLFKLELNICKRLKKSSKE